MPEPNATMICPACARRVKLPKAAGAGQYVRCPHCQAAMPVKLPAPELNPKTPASPTPPPLPQGNAAPTPTGTKAEAGQDTIGSSGTLFSKPWLLWSGVLTLILAGGAAGWQWWHQAQGGNDPGHLASSDPPDDLPPDANPPPASPVLLPMADVILRPGGSRVLAVTVERHDFQGAATLHLDRLPEKVAASPTPLAAEADRANFELIAASDAAPADIVARVRLMDGSNSLSEGRVRIRVLETMALRLAAIPPLTLKPGKSQVIPIQVKRQGFQGLVTLDVEGLPEQVTAGSGTVPPDSDQGELELTAQAKAKEGIVMGRVVARFGDLRAQGQLKVTVAKADTPPSFRLVQVPDVKLAVGEIRLVEIKIERQGFQGDVAVEVTGLPEKEFKVAAANIPAGQDSCNVQVSAAALARLGEVECQVVASTESLQQQVSLRVTVQARPGQERVFLTPNRELVLGVSISPDSKYVLSVGGGKWFGKSIVGSSDNLIRLWDLEHNREVPRRFPKLSRPVRCVAYSPKGRYAVTGGDDGFVRIWDVDKGKEWLPHNKPGHAEPVLGVAFSSDGLLVVSGSKDKTVKLWNAQTGRAGPTFLGHKDGVNSVAISPDSRWVLSAGQDQTARLWEVESGREKQQFNGHTKAVTCVAFAPGGKLGLSGGEDGLVRLWDLVTGQEVRAFKGHEDWVTSVAISPEGDRIISCGYDRTVRVWEVATGKEVQEFDGHSAQAMSVAISATGAFAVSGGLDLSVRLWNLPR